MNSITTRTAEQSRNTIQAIVLLKNGDRIERTIGFDPSPRGDGWKNAMRQVGAGLVHKCAETDIASVLTITTDRHGTSVNHYGATGGFGERSTEALEILGFED